jgi:hypothetical protein
MVTVEPTAQQGLIANEQCAVGWVSLEKIDCGREGHGWTVVTPHAVNRDAHVKHGSDFLGPRTTHALAQRQNYASPAPVFTTRLPR